MSTPETSYLLSDPHPEVAYLDVPEIPTVVSIFTDHPMADMASAYDSTFTALAPALGVEGLRPVGPAFALHTRMPSDTVDMEVGVPVDSALAGERSTDAGVRLIPSRLPAGRVAVVSHVGSYDGLGEAWGRLMEAVTAAGHSPVLPFWEVYVTQPSPEMDPGTLRTDLFTLIG